MGVIPALSGIETGELFPWKPQPFKCRMCIFFSFSVVYLYTKVPRAKALIIFLISSFFCRWCNKIWPWGFCLSCSCNNPSPAAAEPDSDSSHHSAALPQPDPATRLQLHWAALLRWGSRCTQCVPVWADHVCKCHSRGCNSPFVPLCFYSQSKTFSILQGISRRFVQAWENNCCPFSKRRGNLKGLKSWAQVTVSSRQLQLMDF